MGPWFAPLAWLWHAVLKVRHALYDWGWLRSHDSPIPCLVIGNMELGGTGKTPHVMDLAQRLEWRLGKGQVGILSRGYGRSSSTSFSWVAESGRWQEVGDEPWMMQDALPSTPVAVCADRVSGLSRMKQQRPELRLVLLDDGLQHRRLRPTHQLALMSRTAPRLSASQLIPAGPWRDLPSRLQRVDGVVTTHPTAQCPSGATHLGHPRPITGAPQANSPTATPLGPALLVTGIANPARLMESLTGVDLAGVAHYPDHHPFSQKDLKAWQDWGQRHDVRDLLVTKKDAVRIVPLMAQLPGWNLWEIPLSLAWDDEAKLDSWLDSLVETLP